jgi:hypothetical protein
MDKTEYIEWYAEHYGKKPPIFILEKYFPGEYQDGDAVEPEVKIQYMIPAKVQIQFGKESDD